MNLLASVGGRHRMSLRPAGQRRAHRFALAAVLIIVVGTTFGLGAGMDVALSLFVMEADPVSS
jgi:hypothetical protein